MTRSRIIGWREPQLALASHEKRLRGQALSRRPVDEICGQNFNVRNGEHRSRRSSQPSALNRCGPRPSNCVPAPWRSHRDQRPDTRPIGALRRYIVRKIPLQNRGHPHTTRPALSRTPKSSATPGRSRGYEHLPNAISFHGAELALVGILRHLGRGHSRHQFKPQHVSLDSSISSHLTPTDATCRLHLNKRQFNCSERRGNEALLVTCHAREMVGREEEWSREMAMLVFTTILDSKIRQTKSLNYMTDDKAGKLNGQVGKARTQSRAVVGSLEVPPKPCHDKFRIKTT
jgi:hypothetical protein